ncbi:MAG: 30S ribosomal protein S13 [Rhodothermaceae bacterium]|nr:30S ribosomal protein S13 [Rhodothermaceae bacterium]
MARLAGIDLPKEKRGEVGLTYIFGIGRSRSREILEKLGMDFNTKVGDWTEEQVTQLRKLLEADYKLEGALRSEVNANIKHFMDIGCYRGLK